MKNFTLTVVFIAICGQLSHFGLPWWMLAPIGALAGWLFRQGAGLCLLAGFAGGFLLWAGNAYVPDAANEGLLSARIGQLFMGMSRWNTLLLTGCIGGMVSALGCLCGRWGRALFETSKNVR